jgi:hypothetical protein
MRRFLVVDSMTRRRYANDTEVPVDKSQSEVRKMLRELGADRIAVVDDIVQGSAVWFQIPPVAYIVRSPPPKSDMTEAQRSKRTRSDWRAMVLLIKAKKIGIEQGITTVEREFLADAIMPDGSSLMDHAPAMIEGAYRDGGPPRLTFSGGPS